jgi:hypothetical protein
VGAALETWQLVESPPVVPQPYGLFSQSEVRLGTDEHWRLGVQWQSQACGEAKVTTGPCIDEVSPLTPDNLCTVRQFDPFTIYAYNNDAVPGRTLDEHRADASARLVAGEQRSLETEFWTRVLTEVGTPTDLTSRDIRFGLGYIETQLAQDFNGMGVIHMSHLVATLLWDALVVTGGRIYTVHGTPVVVGAGYDIINPLTTPATILGTGPIVMYRGDIDTREQAVNFRRNEVSYIAQRDYVVGWDCGAYGVTVPTTPAV